MNTPRPEPNPDRRRRFSIDVVNRLREAGFLALWAGGCVRDLLLGLEPADYDVATDATPEQVMGLFRRTVPVGVSFGVVRVLGPPGAGEVEVATFRNDHAYVDGRRPTGVTFSTPELDASRRDFTINGMFLDPIDGDVLDFVGGRADLEAGVLRAIGDPAARFEEDKLRLVRAVRFAARFGMRIDPGTRAALVAMADRVRVVAAERVAQELRRMLVHPTRAKAMNLALDVGLLAAILPELPPLRGPTRDATFRPGADLWDKTMLVLEQLPEAPSFPLAMAALLVHAGRPSTVDRSEGSITPDGQEHAGRRITEEIGLRLKLANAERERIGWLVEHHGSLREAPRMRPAKLKRLLASPGIDELLALQRAEALASTGDAAHVDYCEAYQRDRPEGPIQPPPLLTGHDLRSQGLRPGPHFKEILERAYDAQLEGVVRSKAEALAWLDREGVEASDNDDPSPQPDV